MSLREFLKKLDKDDELEHIEKEISPEYEIAAELEKSENALIFENVEGHDMNVVGNICGSRKRIASSLGIEPSEILSKMGESHSNLENPPIVKEGPVEKTTEERVDLERVPILKHFEKDGGPYTTASILTAKDQDGKRNLSFHRMQLIDKDKFAIRLVPRDLYKMFNKAEERGEPLEVAAIIGVHPGIALAAATSTSYDTDEWGIAHNLYDGLKLVECKNTDLEVPATAEIVFEGKILPDERAREGPFADITGTYDTVRQQPVFEVEQITRRSDAMYTALLPSSSEHRFLMGLPREPSIYEEVNRVLDAENVALTPGGCGWLHAAVSIDKKNEKDGKKAIEAAFKGHSSLKHVVVVDKDIDIYDREEIEWAIATRFRGDKDAVIKSGVKGSSLDPRGNPETRLSCKTGIDATKTLGNTERFEKAVIPK